MTPECFDGSNWISFLLGALLGQTNQISITQDPISKAYTIAIADNPILNGITTFNSTSHMKVPAGTTAERPANPQAGDFRYNTSTNRLEFYNDDRWRNT